MPVSSATPLKRVGVSRHNQIASILRTGLGLFLALTSIGVLALSTGGAWVLGSFGASCVLHDFYTKACAK